jgi:hypothetical protein
MSQQEVVMKPRRGGVRGPAMPRSQGGRVTLTPGAAASSVGKSLQQFNRLIREGKLKLTKHYLYEGALPRYYEDEIEALKK